MSIHQMDKRYLSLTLLYHVLQGLNPNKYIVNIDFYVFFRIRVEIVSSLVINKLL